MLTAEVVDGREIQRRVQGAQGSLLLGIGKVSRNLRHALNFAQTVLEEVAGSSIFLATFSGFLCSYEVGVGEGFRFNLFAVEQVKQLR